MNEYGINSIQSEFDWECLLHSNSKAQFEFKEVELKWNENPSRAQAFKAADDKNAACAYNKQWYGMLEWMLILLSSLQLTFLDGP